MRREDDLSRALSAALGAGLADRLLRACAAQGAAPAAFVIAAVEKAVVAAEKKARRIDRPPLDPSMEARLRALIAAALREATDWEGFATALARRDLAMAPSGGGLEVRRRSDGAALAKASSVGPGYAALIRRFRAGMPGHPHGWLVDRSLGAPPPPRRPDADDGALVYYED